MSAELSVAIYLMSIPAVLFALPFLMQNRFNSELGYGIFQRCCFTLALFFMILNGGAIAEIATSAGLSVKKEILAILTILSYFGYPMLAYLVAKTIYDIVMLLNSNKQERRMGESE